MLDCILIEHSLAMCVYVIIQKQDALGAHAHSREICYTISHNQS